MGKDIWPSPVNRDIQSKQKIQFHVFSLVINEKLWQYQVLIKNARK